MITVINNAIAKRRDEDEKGFTLIELLVVILIIGILAAIAIPVFLGQQDQAKDAAAKSDLSNAKTALISFSTEKNGDYTGADAAGALDDYGYVKSTTATAAVELGATDGVFCISVVSDTTTSFAVSDVVSIAKGTCTEAGVFAAPAAPAV